jgi:uncharacterized protein (DUF433 family)
MQTATQLALTSSGIVSDPRYHAGEPIIAGTSTTVRAVAENWKLGVRAEDIPLRLPHLELAQVFEALHYYLTHRDEIEAHIEANRIPDAWWGKRFDPATGRIVDPVTGQPVD